MSHLRLCDRCTRHVRADEASCPFCDAALAPDPGPPALPRVRLSRAKIMAFGVAVAASVAMTGCDDNRSGDDAGPPDAGVVVNPYGSPPAEGAPRVV